MKKTNFELGGVVDFENPPPPGFLNRFLRTAIAAVVCGAVFYAGLLEYEKVIDAVNKERISGFEEELAGYRASEREALDRLPPSVRESRQRSSER